MNILSRSYIFYHGQNSFYYLFFFFFFPQPFPPWWTLSQATTARGSIWGYFSACHRATPWQAPLSSAIRCFYNESLFTGLSMRYLCYPILRLRASNWNFPSRESFDSSRWVSLSIPISGCAHTRARTRGIILVRQVYRRDTKRSSDLHAARFSTDKISPLAKFIREHDPCTIRVQAFSSGRKKSQRFFLSGISMESKKGKAPLFLGFILHFSF